MNPERHGSGKRRVEWVIERLVERRLGRKSLEKVKVWVRVAPSKEFTTKGAVGYVRRLRALFPNTTYRFRHIVTGEVVPSELFGL